MNNSFKIVFAISTFALVLMLGVVSESDEIKAFKGSYLRAEEISP